MKNRLISLVTFLILINTSAAKAGGCDFNDQMHVQGPVGTQILELSGSGLIVERQGGTDFLIIGRCKTSFEGTVTVKIGTDTNHSAVLTIKESAYMWNPEIINIVSTGGFSYAGMDHDQGSYSYTLKFL